MSYKNDLMISMIRNLLFGAPISCGRLTEKEITQLLAVAKVHNVENLVAACIYQNRLTDDEKSLEECSAIMYSSIFRCEELVKETKRIFELFDSRNIPYIPLKGSVSRSLYPKPWMRSSRDIDILVKPADIDSAGDCLCSALGYSEVSKGTHDHVFSSPKGFHIEIHFDLVEDRYFQKANRYLRSIWDRAEASNNETSLFRMDSDSFFYYHVVHSAKHFKDGGCGIKALTDLQLYRKQLQYGSPNFKQWLSDSGLAEFERQMTILCDYWFDSLPPSEETMLISDYILSGGFSIGNANLEKERIVEHKGKKRYFLSRIFLPFKLLKTRYPVLEKHPYLAPFCHVARLYSLLFGKRKRLRQEEMSRINSVSEDELSKYNSVIQIVDFK